MSNDNLLSCRVKKVYGVMMAWVIAWALALTWIGSSIWLAWAIYTNADFGTPSDSILPLVVMLVFICDPIVVYLASCEMQGERVTRNDLLIWGVLYPVGVGLLVAKIGILLVKYVPGVWMVASTVTSAVIVGYVIIWYICEMEKGLIRTRPKA